MAISGCYFEYRGVRQNFLDVSGCGNKDADLTLVAGDKDTTCAAWQSDDAAAQLRSAGYDVQLLTLQGPAIIRPLTRQAAAGHCGDEDNARARAVAVLVRSSESSTEQPRTSDRVTRHSWRNHGPGENGPAEFGDVLRREGQVEDARSLLDQAVQIARGHGVHTC